MLNLEILIFLNVTLRLSLKKSIINLYNNTPIYIHTQKPKVPPKKQTHRTSWRPHWARERDRAAACSSGRPRPWPSSRAASTPQSARRRRGAGAGRAERAPPRPRPHWAAQPLWRACAPASASPAPGRAPPAARPRAASGRGGAAARFAPCGAGGPAPSSTRGSTWARSRSKCERERRERLSLVGSVGCFSAGDDKKCNGWSAGRQKRKSLISSSLVWWSETQKRKKKFSLCF